MRIVDISRSLGPDTPVYPGDPPVIVERLSVAAGGDTSALSRLTIGTHTGTHVDSPAHFIDGGATVDAIPLDACIGPAFVLDVTGMVGPLAEAVFESVPPDTKRLLLRSGGPPVGGTVLTLQAARAAADRGLRLIGIDTLSVAPIDAPGDVHRILLGAGVIILEGLDLSGAPEGPATLICLPLKIAGGDGAPARAVLLYDGEDAHDSPTSSTPEPPRA